MATPVILLAFANERTGARYLRNLPLEQNRLRKVLEKAEDNGLCEVVVLANATLANLADTLQREKYRDRIAVFHYGGHAGSKSLFLEQSDGSIKSAHASGIVPLLAGQKSLKLVFINGCHSSKQAKHLTDSGIPITVGTLEAVRDDIATDLAVRFYQALGEGMPIGKAWQGAIDVLIADEGEADETRYFETKRGEEEIGGLRPQFPWEIYVRTGAEDINNWNLPEAASNPYFGLPDLARRFDLPGQPYRFLERYTRKDTRIFFGRGNYIRDIYHRINNAYAAPVLLLYGQSGVGKSSLLEAGLFPRLEEEYEVGYIRRDIEIGLLGHLKMILGEGEDLLTCWKKQEAQSDKKGLIILLDQVEEVFTRPNEADKQELENFMTAIAQLFSNPEDRPAGKLMLSYRKEYDSEIEKACREVFLPKEKLFIDRLDRAGIIEVVEGLTSTTALQHKYRVEVEDNLGVVIADDLLVDRDSPISPVLQIILTRMWQQDEGKDKRFFSVADYNELRQKGIFLDDFFQQQMTALAAWEKEQGNNVVSSGLALDVLKFHTTQLSTAESRNLEEIRRLYSNRSDVLEPLLQKLSDLYLLSSISGQHSALAHDTLAPIVRKEMNQSDRPGQRALRILQSKTIEYELDPDNTYIDSTDLKIVEDGADGVHAWTDVELALVEKSRVRRAKLEAARKRTKQVQRIGVALISLLALVASVVGFRYYQQLQAEKIQVEISDLIAEALRAERTDATQALGIISEALEKMPNDRNALQARHDIYSENEFYEFGWSQNTTIKSVALTPDNSTIASAGGNKVILWNIENEQALDSFFFDHPIHSICFSPDGSLLLVICLENTAFLLQPKSRVKERLQGHSDWVTTGTFDKKGNQIITGDRTGLLILWNKKGEIIRRWQGHENEISSLDFSTDGSRVTSGSWDQTVKQWQINGTLLQEIELDTEVLSVSCDPIGEKILVGTRAGFARIWNEDGTPYGDIMRQDSRINSVAFSPDGQKILTASDDKQIKLWNREGRLLKTYKGHHDYVKSISFSIDGQYFVSGSKDKSLKYWKVDSKEELAIDHKGKPVSTVAFLPDGKIVSGIGRRLYEVDVMDQNISDEELLRMLDSNLVEVATIWNILGQPVRTLSGHEGSITALAVSQDGQNILTGSDDKQVLLWDITGNVQKVFRGHKGQITGLKFAPSQQVFASAASDSTVLLWNINGDLIIKIPHPRWVSSVDFSPDGTKLLTGCMDGIARLWDMEGEILKTIEIEDSGVKSVAFSPDERQFAIGTIGNNTQLKVWDISGSLVFSTAIFNTNKNGGKGINSIDYSSDGSYIVIGLEGGLIKIFDKYGKELQTLKEPTNADVNEVTFSPDDKWILVGCGSGWVRMFKTALY